MNYIIKDWAGNILHYTGRFERPEFAVAMEFEHFDKASDWLADTFGHLEDKAFEEQMSEFHIEEASHGSK